MKKYTPQLREKHHCELQIMLMSMIEDIREMLEGLAKDDKKKVVRALEQMTQRMHRVYRKQAMDMGKKFRKSRSSKSKSV
jgi:predicted secreted Zn-dependent protease